MKALQNVGCFLRPFWKGWKGGRDLPLLQIIASLKKQVFIGFHFHGFDFSEENLVKKKIMEILILAGVDHFP